MGNDLVRTRTKLKGKLDDGNASMQDIQDSFRTVSIYFVS